GSRFGILLIENGNNNQPNIKFAEEPSETKNRKQEHARSKFAVERQHDELRMQLRRPVNRGAELPIERSAYDQEQGNRKERQPASSARKSGRFERDEQRTLPPGRAYGQAIHPPIQPQQKSGNIEDPIEPFHAPGSSAICPESFRGYIIFSKVSAMTVGVSAMPMPALRK